MSDVLLSPEGWSAVDSVERRFSYDYLLGGQKPHIRFPRYRNPGEEPGLPPEEFWLINPDRDKFDTPVDDRGLIDQDLMIRAVKDTIDPSYEWPAQLSLDHFYWPGYWYDRSYDPQAGRFRQLSIHKGIVPREWENWKHKITIPPRLPSPEVMHLRIESWDIAHSLFRSITETERWRRRAEGRALQVARGSSCLPRDGSRDDVIGKEFMQGVLSKYFRAVEKKLRQLETIPREFRLVEPGDPQDIMPKTLMRLVGGEALYLADTVRAA